MIVEIKRRYINPSFLYPKNKEKYLKALNQKWTSIYQWQQQMSRINWQMNLRSFCTLPLSWIFISFCPMTSCMSCIHFFSLSLLGDCPREQINILTGQSKHPSSLLLLSLAQPHCKGMPVFYVLGQWPGLFGRGTLSLKEDSVWLLDTRLNFIITYREISR